MSLMILLNHCNHGINVEEDNVQYLPRRAVKVAAWSEVARSGTSAKYVHFIKLPLLTSVNDIGPDGSTRGTFLGTFLRVLRGLHLHSAT